MSGMRTLLCLLLMLGQPSLAQASSPEDQLRTFATCAGRLTAQLEHQWLMQTAGADALQRQRGQIVELLEAVMPRDRGRDVLNWRIEARAAQRALLQRATFGTQADDAAWASQMAEQFMADCTVFLLS